MDMEDEHDIFDASSVSVDQYQSHVDAQVSGSFATLDHGEYLSGSHNEEFAEALSMMGEISKFNASIGSCNVSDNDCPMFAKRICTTMTDLENSLSDVMDPSAVDEVMTCVSAAQASQANNGLSKEQLSKLG